MCVCVQQYVIIATMVDSSCHLVHLFKWQAASNVRHSLQHSDSTDIGSIL